MALLVNDIVDVIASLPEAKEMGDRGYWQNVVPKYIPMVLDDMAAAHDFEFTLDVQETATVADQAEYEFEGNNKNCRDIINIRYGDGEDVLTQYRATDMDEIVDAEQDPSSVFGWYHFGRSSAGYPKVTIVATPSTAETLKIRYRRNDITLDMFPDEFGYVIVRGVLAWLSDAKRRQYDKALAKMVRRYKAGGKDLNVGAINPHMVGTNNDIAALYETG